MDTLPAVENIETFFARLDPWMAPSDLLKVRLAYLLSKNGHRHQFRKELDAEGEPVRYFEHPRRVAIFLIDVLGVRDPDSIIVALLHDALEDTRITQEMLEFCFGKGVTQSIKLLSKLHPKDLYYERLSTFGNIRDWGVKCSDRADNLSHMENCTPEFIAKQLKETKEKVLPILRLIPLDNPMYAKLSNTLYHLIKVLGGS